LSDVKNISNSNQETVTMHSNNPQKAQVKQAEQNIKTDLTKGVIKQNTFKHNYRNGYADGTVKEEKKKILAERKKAKVGR